ncbi:MAG: hypothetical protein NW217_14340 [Hyphomicrobiaceae bacterium]|nr:hypothetical protein [Hyphomicrobiaceae bacterium]
MTKFTTVAVAALLLATGIGAAEAAPRHKFDGSRGQHGYSKGVNGFERAAIRRSAARLAALRRQVHADGRVTIYERLRLRQATTRHARLVRQAHRG